MTKEEIKQEKQRLRKQIEFLNTYLSRTSPNVTGWNEKFNERADCRECYALIVELEKEELYAAKAV